MVSFTSVNIIPIKLQKLKHRKPMFTIAHLASGKLVHAYFKGTNSTDKEKLSLRNRVNLQSNVCEVN
jgi:hypothetical protein